MTQATRVFLTAQLDLLGCIFPWTWFCLGCWDILGLLVGGFNPFENISQIGSSPQVGVKIKKSLKPPKKVELKLIET